MDMRVDGTSCTHPTRAGRANLLANGCLPFHLHFPSRDFLTTRKPPSIRARRVEPNIAETDTSHAGRFQLTGGAPFASTAMLAHGEVTSKDTSCFFDGTRCCRARSDPSDLGHVKALHGISRLVAAGANADGLLRGVRRQTPGRQLLAGAPLNSRVRVPARRRWPDRDNSSR